MPTTIAALGTRFEQGIYTSFRGGINNATHPELIADNELSDARNWIPDKLTSGGIITREGLTKALANSQGERFRSLYQGANNIYFSGTQTVKDYLNNTIFTAGTPGLNGWDWTSWVDASVSRDLFVDSSSAPQKTGGTSGTTAAVGGSPPVSAAIKTFRNMVFVIPSTAASPRIAIRWSNVGTFETWPAVNALNIGRTNNILLGMAPFHGVLWVGAENSFHHITGDNQLTIQVSYSSYEEGLASHRAIVPTPHGLFWWSRSGAGLCWSKDGFGGASIDRPLMRKAPATANTISQGGGNPFFTHGFWNSIHNRVEFRMPLTSSNVCDFAVFYYPDEDSLWFINGPAAACSASTMCYPSVSGTAFGQEPVAVLGLDSTTSYLYKQTGTTDDSTSITAYLKGKQGSTEFGAAAVKRWETLIPQYCLEGATNATMSYGVYVDNNTTLKPITTLPLNGTASTQVDKVIGWGRKAHKLQHRFDVTAAVRARVRGILTQGYVVNT